MNLKLSRRELDKLRNIYGRDPDLRDLLDYVATLERENASLRTRQQYAMWQLDAVFSAIDEWWANGSPLEPKTEFQKGMATITNIVLEFATEAYDELKNDKEAN